MQPTPEKRFTLKAPSVGTYGGAITCEVTRSVLRVGHDGLLCNLTEEQALEFLAVGWEVVEGRAVLALRNVADAYARAAAAFATAEDAAAAAIRAARVDGVPEGDIDEILSLAGKAQQTVLPPAAEIAGPPPAAPKAPAPAVKPVAVKAEPAVEKKPASRKLSTEPAASRPAAGGIAPAPKE